MTTLNTIIEEEKEEAHKYWNQEAQNTEQKWLTPDTWGIIYEIITSAMQRAYEEGANNERASWLRSEIEKLEQRQLLNVIIPTKSPLEHALREREHNVLASIITRYKEELNVLESK